MYRAYATRAGDADQPRHPPPARAARRQRPPQDRAPERAALLAAGHARPLLRRRDRHGGQRLPRRPQRRAHADAVEHGPQRRLLAAPTRSGSILPVIIDPEYHYESINVESAAKQPDSLLWWTKRLIALRQALQAFGRGSIEFLNPENPRVLAFVRELRGRDDPRRREPLALRPVRRSSISSKYQGRLRAELFGKSRFPRIGSLPYLLTLGQHAFYWFSLDAPAGEDPLARRSSYPVPAIEASSFRAMTMGAERAVLEEVLPTYLVAQHWFDQKGRDRAHRHRRGDPGGTGGGGVRAVARDGDLYGRQHGHVRVADGVRRQGRAHAVARRGGRARAARRHRGGHRRCAR